MLSGENHTTAANGLGSLSAPARRLRATALLPRSQSFPGSAKIMGFQTLSLFLFLPIVDIFLFVDNNLMCLETASSAYVPLGIIFILLQMVWSIFFSK